MSEERGGREQRPEDEQSGSDVEGQGGRRGLPDKGFDSGTGYGGAGGDSAYRGESSYGGQAGDGGATTRGAYAGGKFGRPDEPASDAPSVEGTGEVKPDLADPDATGG